MKAKSKNTMKESVVVKDVEVQEEAEVELEGVVVEDVEDVAKEEVLEVKLKNLKQMEKLSLETKITMKGEIIKETEEMEDHIVEEMLIKKEIVKVVTNIQKEEVQGDIKMIKEVQETILMTDHQVDTRETIDKMKEVLKVEPKVGQELITTIKIDQEEMELKVVTTMRVELEEETEVPDHKLLMTNQPIVELEEEI